MCTDVQDTRYLISSNLQAEGEGNGSGPTCKFTDHASNAVHGSVAEHEFDLDWYGQCRRRVPEEEGAHDSAPL